MNKVHFILTHLMTLASSVPKMGYDMCIDYLIKL